MKYFKLTAIGPTIDKVTLMPGTVLAVSGDVPSHWSRFGECISDPTNQKEGELVVATPKANEHQSALHLESLDESEIGLEEAQEAYFEQFGKKPDGRWSVDRILDEMTKG